MSRAVEEKAGPLMTPPSSSTASPASTSLSPAGDGKRGHASPHKKASPSDVIFGKPPGTDSACQAYEALNADSSSSGSNSASISASKIGTSDVEKTSIAEANINSETQGSSGGSNSNSAGADSETSSDGQSRRPDASQRDASEARMEGDAKMLPALFEDADAEDIVVLVADMLSRLTTHNDLLPLHPTSLTRFHSRATPSISVLSYLKRITKYTSLEKSCTLILLVYIDRVCQRISGFTICSLTVHRFICAAVVCASKALCDSFSTNGHYARVGGISLIELNMLEKEFLNIIDWKLSCSGALLQHYYVSLVKSHRSYQLESKQEQQGSSVESEQEQSSSSDVDMDMGNRGQQ